MAPTVSSSSSKGAVAWRPTKIMNMRDLSKDDDFLSHLLVEKLGTGNVPLLVHKMDPSRRLPKVPAQDLLDIVRRLVIGKGALNIVVRQTVDDLLRLTPIRYYLQSYTQKQINAFATHASRYFELYQPAGSIEISHTSRYSHRTGKSELCILATKPMSPGTVITELKGSMANLTEEEDRELKRTDLRNFDIRRDFSVIHSKSMKKNHLFLGPARFVNHDCDNNCELFREGRYITFRVIKPIAIGEEITAHYGDGYFGKKNRHCLCETCEKKGRGGYAPDHDDNEAEMSDSSTDTDDESGTVSNAGDLGREATRKKNLDERRTRRGVYAVMNKEEDLSDESENEEENILPLAGAPDIPAAVEIELAAEVGSELTSLSSSTPLSDVIQLIASTSSASRSTSSLSSLSSSVSAVEENTTLSTPQSNSSTPYRSIISTRLQKAQQDSPLTASPSRNRSTSKRATRSTSIQLYPSKGKGKAKAVETPSHSLPSTPVRLDKGKEKEGSIKIKKEEVEIRVLRTKPSVSSSHQDDQRNISSRPQGVPKGPDGKPLPLCMTCKNVLPVISVDSKVVWGLGMEKKKKLKQECPRCMRHMAIYGQPWPRRIPLPGAASFVVTPSEDNPSVETLRRVTHNALPTLDRKLAAAASKRIRHDESSLEEPVSKKSRLSLSLSPGKGRSRGSEGNETPISEPPKRKRGRPRLTSPRPTKKAQVIIKLEEEEVTLHSFKDQPRRSNGQFGGKSNSVPRAASQTEASPIRNREQRALEREKLRAKLEKGSKRSGESEVNDPPSSKRRRWDDEGHKVPLQRMVPKPSPFRTLSGLMSKPNPMRFATQAWAGPLVAEDGASSEEDKGPDTLEDAALPPAVIDITTGFDSEKSSATVGMIPSLTYKPSPFNFARRKWSSMSRPPTEEPTPQREDEASEFDLESLSTLSSSEATTPITPPSSIAETLLETNQFFMDSKPAPTRLMTTSRWDEVYSSDEEDTLHFIPPPISPPSFVQYSAIVAADKQRQQLDVLGKLSASDKSLTRISSRFLSSHLSDSPPSLISAGWDDDL
ncbi:hypothetical protein E1B28_000565 [Marasmius oreades]|uniref:SET domain-containing protein n=1 Tax=Marasmius oreades TaxID=181124 RepID=A0A9P7V1M3_9AGAR|nr:uncharacterized protein E1B28_000565 [Marasmius oreades]KAG7098649.1 hypothetical protein E1B28_000565 [Marasmius oreades]